MAAAAADPGLLRCPKNLKECIDWVLRATGKDDLKGTGNNNNLKKALKAELNGSELTDDLTQLVHGLESFIGYSNGGQGIGKNAGGPQKFSSYNPSEATWNNLCEKCQCKKLFSNSNPSRCSCSCSGSQTGSSVVCSDPKSCCPDCDVRKAAKIFLGFIPCLYYGLKFLKERCEKDKSEGGWKNLNISSDNSLHRFLVGMGYDVDKELNEKKTGSEIFGLLSPLFKDSDGPLEKLYEKSQNYFTSRFTSHVPSSTSSDSKPETVRSILLWLSGLPFASGFKDLLKHCKDLCLAIKDSSNPVQFNDFESSLYASCLRSPFVLAAIQWPSKSEIFPLNFSDSLYPSDPFDLFNMLLENVRKVFPPLKFLCMQCENGAAQGGWKDCAFGRQCAEALQKSLPSGSSSSSGCGSSCSGSKTYLCSNSHSSCSGSSSSGSCPHPLVRFLIDDSESTSKDPQKFPTPFRPPEGFPPMGFSKENLSSTARDGWSLYHVLKVFCKDGFYPLSRLAEFALCISQRPPETLGELFGFFKKFVPKLKSDPLGKKFVQWIEGEPGEYSGEDLKTALEKLFGSHSGSHSDLQSLSSCDGGSTCGKYLYPLTYNAYNNKNFIEGFLDTYLSWICYRAEKFKEKLEEFQGEFLDCCSKSSCQNIVECPCILPKFYKYGFTFWSPKGLNNGKKCSQFIDQLKKVLQSNAPLGLLIKQIENFLWSIRKPFFLFVLSFWAFVISYFLYVQLYKLDLLHLKSHAHFSRSFKILPSTLFSDASSKLKDLSYFSL